MKRFSLVLALLCASAVAGDETAPIRGFGVIGIATVCEEPVAIVAQDRLGRTVFYAFTKLHRLPPSVLAWLNDALDTIPEDRIIYMTLDDTLKDQGIKVICPKPPVKT